MNQQQLGPNLTFFDLQPPTTDMLAEVSESLRAPTPTLHPKFFYDETGSNLFDRITRTPEYYPTRTERGILTEHAAAIADVTQAKTVIELGAGSPEKSSILLRELGMRDSGHEFIPVDISTTYLEHIESSMAKTLPHVTVRPIQADFADRMPFTQGEPARLVLFLGGTLGNLDRLERACLLYTSPSPRDRG